MKMYNPAHPRKLLKAYIDDICVTDVTKKLSVSRGILSRILNGKAGITPEMAVRLLNSTTSKLWLDMQANDDLWQI
jgi:addiction module antidote protein HigA